MKIRKTVLLLFVGLIAIQCNAPQDVIKKQNEMDSVALENDTTFHCDSLSIQTPIGTACCVSGPTKAKQGDTLKYQYQMNHIDPAASWEILEGNITILSGQDTRTVTVQFGAGFTGGVIQAYGFGYKDGIKENCNDRIIITQD